MYCVNLSVCNFITVQYNKIIYPLALNYSIYCLDFEIKIQNLITAMKLKNKTGLIFTLHGLISSLVIK